MLRLALVIALATLLASCGTSPSKVHADDAIERAARVPLSSMQPSRHGAVLVSLGTQVNDPFKAVSLAIRPLGQGARTDREDWLSRPHVNRLGLNANLEQPAALDAAANVATVGVFSTASERGAVLVGVLPPGRYEVYSVGMAWRGYLFSAQPFFRIPIEVRAGATTYLGRYVARLTSVTNSKLLFLDVGTPGKGYLSVRSELEADWRVAQSFAPLAGFAPFDASASACEPRVPFSCGPALP